MNDVILVNDKYVKIEKIKLGSVTLSTNTIWKIPCNEITPELKAKYSKYVKED